MPRAKLTYDKRVLLEDMYNQKVSRKEMCETLGITPFELQQELNLGWIRAGKRYSAEKAQFSLK